MKIVELFESIQGEGPEVGMRCTFLRLTGCNLNCPWCDTESKNQVNMELPVKDVVRRIKTHNLVITGGEPMLQRDEVYELINNFLGHVSLETNGSISFKPKYFDTVVVSPKTSQVLRTWVKKMERHWNVYLKIVIHDNHTWGLGESIDELVSIIPDSSRIYLMPAGKNMLQVINASRHVTALLKAFKMVRYSPRLHILMGWR